MPPVKGVPGLVQYIETESRMVVPGTGEKGHGALPNGRVSVWNDKKSLQDGQW